MAGTGGLNGGADAAAEQASAARETRGRARRRWAGGVSGGCAAVAVLAWVSQRWPGESWWPTALLVYAPQAAWAGLALIAALAVAWGRDLLTVALGGSAIVVVIAGLTGMQVALPARPGGGSRAIVATWNVQNEHQRAASFRAALEGVGADVVFLQEATDRSWQASASGWEGRRGEALWTAVRGEILDAGLVALEGSWRPAYETRFDLGGRRVAVLNVHLTVASEGESLFRSPDGSRAYLGRTTRARRRQLTDIAAWAASQTDPYIIAGDFNTPPHTSSFRPLNPLAADAFAQRGMGFGYTYRSDLPLWRIDQIRVSPDWRVLQCGMFGGRLSDHKGVWAELELR